MACNLALSGFAVTGQLTVRVACICLYPGASLRVQAAGREVPRT